MQEFLDKVAARHPQDKIIMVLDGAGWHASESLKPQAKLRLPELPPNYPDLNQVEHLWGEIREKTLHNLVFDSISVLERHLESALRKMENDLALVLSIVAWSWIVKSLVN